VTSLIRCCNLGWILMKKSIFTLVCAAHFSLLDFVGSGCGSLSKSFALGGCPCFPVSSLSAHEGSARGSFLSPSSSLWFSRSDFHSVPQSARADS
jgi:hypothetical protein